MNDYEGQKPFVNGFNEQSFRREVMRENDFVFQGRCINKPFIH